jgi:hypothetical protein
MRGYVYRRKSDLFFSCHNCGAGLSFGNFLKITDRALYASYQMDRFKDSNGGNTAKPDFSLVMQKPVFNIKTKIDLPTIESLSDNNDAKRYLVERKLPKEKLSSIYFADDFKSFVFQMLPDYDKKLFEGEKRIIFPFYDEKNILLGFQGRAIGASKVKYITVKLSDDNKKVFGLNTVDKTKKIYVVEGPIDSLFLHNSLAMMDASLYNVASSVGSYDYTFVYDNEPRNKDIIKHMQKTIDFNKDICIWPKDITQKDINDMVLAGMSSEFITHILKTNTYRDLAAKLALTKWSKV